MKHPAFRIFIALFMAIWSPICCCQAAFFMGAGCGTEIASNEVISGMVSETSCCSRCGHQQEPSESDATSQSSDQGPADRQSDCPDERCPSCPTCQGFAGGTGSTASLLLKLVQPQLDVFATLHLASLLTGIQSLPDTSTKPFTCSRHEPAQPRAGRSALRWHCALVV